MPGRPTGRSGILLCIAIALTGCDAIGGGATIQLDSAEVTLGGGAEVHDVEIGGGPATDSITPSSVDITVGDAVRFVTTDNRPHAPAFDAAGLNAEARAYLERTTQLRGPPLVDEGAAWVVVFRDAPPGEYPFHCRSHDATGVVRVSGG